MPVSPALPAGMQPQAGCQSTYLVVMRSRLPTKPMTALRNRAEGAMTNAMIIPTIGPRLLPRANAQAVKIKNAAPETTASVPKDVSTASLIGGARPRGLRRARTRKA